MSTRYEIHPRVGVARLGNSPDGFYLAPESVGGLPLQCEINGDVIRDRYGRAQHVKQFKDSVGRIYRQAAKFRIFEVLSDNEQREINIEESDIQSIKWTVHIANKKPVWYTFSELQGNLEFGEENSYQNQHVAKNNGDTTDPAKRKALMIDPGPRSIERTRGANYDPAHTVEFSRYNKPADYQYFSFPSTDNGGQQIDILGELKTDSQGNLVALGGFGNVTGSSDITSFRGAAGYWDDVSDGYVQATITLNSGETIDADPAWLLVGSPKYAPELVNISTLWDTQYNTAIRHMGLDKDIYENPTPDHYPLEEYDPLYGYNRDYVVDFETQVKPIFDRMQGYRWVADIPYLADFVNPPFDLTSRSRRNLRKRRGLFNLFRIPLVPELYKRFYNTFENGPQTLFSQQGIPLLPLNSGDNSVTNSGPVYKFETLTATQYFFLHQWAEGKFEVNRRNDEPPLLQKIDEAAVGNCVGAPFSPGIETTWIVRNHKIYTKPFQLKLAHFEGNNAATQHYYQENGLSTTEDEGQGMGCEPGDLTKRMAIPWQADFNECTVQTPNISDPYVNQLADGTGIEVPPAYYVYWWPPQSPMHVMTGSVQPQEQVLDAIVSQIASQPVIPAGQRVPYQRGILNVQDMINHWGWLGFIVDQGTDDYPYLVEQERNFGDFGQAAASQIASLKSNSALK